MSKLVAVGRVSKLFGEGLYVNLYDGFPDKQNQEEPLFVVIDNLEVPLFVNSFNRRGRSGADFGFDDIDTPARRESLLGMELFVRGKDEVEVEKSDETLFEDLIGYKVLINGSVKGVIEDFIDGENPLFQIISDGREILIPAVDEFVEEFDEVKQRIKFVLPEGLLELYTEE